MLALIYDGKARLREDERFYFTQVADGWEVGRFCTLDDLGFATHAITTRQGPDPLEMAENPEQTGIARALNLDGLAWCKQVHGAHVLTAIEPGLAGEGDAIITDVPSLGLVLRSADCPLILVADRMQRGIGVAHASWRSTVGGVASAMIAELAAHFGVDPENAAACIAPSAGPCCYEVGPEVRSAALDQIGPQAKEFFPQRDGRTYFDLWSANVDQLKRAGIQAENIHVSEICTICNHDRFPSYRADNSTTGRFAAVLAIRPQ